MYLSLSITEPDDPILVIKNAITSVRKILDNYISKKVKKIDENDWIVFLNLSYIENVTNLFINVNNNTNLFLEQLETFLSSL